MKPSSSSVNKPFKAPGKAPSKQKPSNGSTVSEKSSLSTKSPEAYNPKSSSSLHPKFASSGTSKISPSKPTSSSHHAKQPAWESFGSKAVLKDVKSGMKSKQKDTASSTGVSGVDKATAKATADLVVKQLTPYYSEGKFVSKVSTKNLFIRFIIYP